MCVCACVRACVRVCACVGVLNIYIACPTKLETVSQRSMLHNFHKPRNLTALVDFSVTFCRGYKRNMRLKKYTFLGVFKKLA